MGEPPVSEPRDKQQRDKEQQQGAARWPFDPMQPGDHEPVQLPEELERLQKQTGAGRPEKGRNPADKA
jgi:hypothetical protein